MTLNIINRRGAWRSACRAGRSLESCLHGLKLAGIVFIARPVLLAGGLRATM